MRLACQGLGAWESNTDRSQSAFAGRLLAASGWDRRCTRSCAGGRRTTSRPVGRCCDVLAGHEHDPYESMLQLRLLGAVHRLALTGEAPALGRPLSVHRRRRRRSSRSGRPFRKTLVEQRPRLRELIERPVQTNEVGRSRALALGFAEAARRTALPLRLLELGSSGGLNLRWDRFRYESGGFVFGDPDSPVRFADYHEGRRAAAPRRRGGGRRTRRL